MNLAGFTGADSDNSRKASVHVPASTRPSRWVPSQVGDFVPGMGSLHPDIDTAAQGRSCQP